MRVRVSQLALVRGKEREGEREMTSRKETRTKTNETPFIDHRDQG